MSGVRRRAAQRARAAKLDALGRQWDETTPPEEFESTARLHSVIYRLQSRDRDGRFVDRIRELHAEIERRHEEGDA